MKLEPRCRDKVIRLVEKGVDIPNPLSIDVGDEVDPDRISGDGVRIEAGCRIFGAETAISPGVRLGAEGPVTLDNCQLGPGVELKGGYAREATLLAGASMGLGAHVREGCLLEEQASGAHCVGLKQTILLPFVTLGSLVNFCDCLMAGGTSRRNHSEVGSSYIHFNFTPDGEKTTPSLIGDVPRGVMLNQRPVFLGGQGGMVGPLRVEYGNVIAAGTILRRDVLEQDRLVVGAPPRGGVLNFVPRKYAGVRRIVENNIRYLANLAALEQWYEHVRRPFFRDQALGDLVYGGARKRLQTATAERVKRMRDMVGNIYSETRKDDRKDRSARGRREFVERFDEIAGLFEDGLSTTGSERERDGFLAFLDDGVKGGRSCVEAVQSLPRKGSEAGTSWLRGIVDDLCGQAASLVPGLSIFSRPDA
ncbi:MAG: UDP-N-acetylglucosamine pyrophosphorylase [Deltaproteobacteria bacterium]|nr:UDP-N-acetylglucosamine pyrophosphorylase [Deltaproteobacteria bacterium]